MDCWLLNVRQQIFLAYLDIVSENISSFSACFLVSVQKVFCLSLSWMPTISSVSGLFILDCPFRCLWFVHSWLLLQVSLVCPFLISISGVSGLSILDCPFRCLWFVHSWLPLQVSLVCPVLIKQRIKINKISMTYVLR